MLDRHLIAEIRPQAKKENVVLWKDYRVTVLQDRLFRVEKNAEKIFRDKATLSVFYRDMPAQKFDVQENEKECVITTSCCRLILRENREDCRIEVKGELQEIDNTSNLKGTYRSLDGYDGKRFYGLSGNIAHHKKVNQIVELEDGVCSANGVAVFDDASTNTLDYDGEVKEEFALGSDEYIFAYGHDYRGAVKALYMITGNTPKLPRYALGNWWCRFHPYSDKTYIKLVNKFEEEEVPLTVGVIDMDWHLWKELDSTFKITESGKNTEFYGGNRGWTGYSWNKKLFPDHRKFLKQVQAKGLQVTLNLHPAGGVRWFEDCYEEMAKAMGRDASSGEWIKFDIADPNFINAYFSVAHKPYEEDGVAFWWVDWQQGFTCNIKGLDPLWSLNHYHYLDNASNHDSGLLLSRYCGIGSHRYPLGFSGDTIISWETLEWLPEFTATSSNAGYTWWSHDIGGHMYGNKDDELYLRHMQYGVFSPINRLHSTLSDVCTKEPWAYGNGAGEIAKNYMRFRHRLIPYLHSANYRTYKEGVALTEPLYYEWDTPEAYEHKNEYIFGGELLVAPITQKAEKDGFARVNVWLPQGRWTDIFTGAEYEIGEGGKSVTMLREMDSIPVLIREGGVLPLSMDKGNSVKNPEKMEINVYSGNGGYTLYEDGEAEKHSGEAFTVFKTEYTEQEGKARQTLTISVEGDESVLPANRLFAIRFKDIPEGEITVYANGEKIDIDEYLTDCVALDLEIKEKTAYKVEVVYDSRTRLQKIIAHACQIILRAREETKPKDNFWIRLREVKSIEEYIAEVESATEISETTKLCLKEIL